MAKILGGLILAVCIVAIGAYAYIALSPGPGEPEPLPSGSNIDIAEAPVTVDVPEGPAPEEDAIVFDMAYRGLDGKDDLRYGSYSGYGQGNGNDNDFIKHVKKTAGKIKGVHNPNFKGAEHAAVEYEGKKVLALYFDLNADGQLTDNEKIVPTSEADKYGRTELVTPDFVMTTKKGQKVPFRTLLQVAFYGESSNPNCMWSPACLLEGKATVDGEQIRMRLLSDGFSGSFTEFGRGGYSLGKDQPDKGTYISRQTLSSLINYGGQFYHMRFIKNAEKEGAIRAILEKDTSPTGKIAVKLDGKEGVKTRLDNTSLSGATDSTVQFFASGGKEIVLPEGEYKIDRGYIYYGEEDSKNWYVDFTKGPSVKVAADETATVTIGKPELAVSAIDQKKRYHSDAEEKSVYTKGTTVFLSPKIKGMAGEQYGRFSRTKENRRTDSPPTVEIVDAEGKQVASATMEYG